MEKIFILSNNPLVWQYYPQAVYIKSPLREVLVKARDYIHQGHRLVSHPLAGSVKPSETLYKSLLLTTTPSTLDYHSLQLIEEALATVDKLAPKQRNWGEKVKKDFQFIDYTLLITAIEHLSPTIVIESV